jgi:sugar-phosphatase
VTNPLRDRRFAAVLFDLDGTLVDSTASVQRSWTAWAAEFGITEDDLRRHHGMPSRAIIAGVAAAGALEPVRVDEATARITELEIADAVGIAALPGAARALAVLLPERAAIVTSCTRPLADARIHAAGLPVPPVLVSADRVQRGKPDPESYELAAQELRVAPGDCLVVEDAPAGLLAAKAAGCATLALTTTTATDALDADLIVADLGAVRFVVTPEGIGLTFAG